MKKALIIGAVLVIVFYFVRWTNIWVVATVSVGDPVDSLHGVVVYYNGNTGNVLGRNVAKDGYNLGLKYQCVEFVKRYYYQHLNHKMPNSYGHAKDFFDSSLNDGGYNKQRDLYQFVNFSSSKPQADDLLVYAPTTSNPYGHVSIVAKVSDSEVEIIQQNPGAYASSRARYELVYIDDKWRIGHDRILGWLRKKIGS